jgi:hypothetical protein
MLLARMMNRNRNRTKSRGEEQEEGGETINLHRL